MERDYIQPSFFQFGSDSIKLVEKITHDYRDNLVLGRVADFCSGCGVIGIELFCSELIIERIDFYERNIEYRAYLKKNLEMFYPNYNEVFPQLENVHFQDIATIENTLFDLIVCNPPYFYETKNRVSKCQGRRLSRFFTDCSFTDFVQEITARLKKEGRGYVLYRIDEIKNEKDKINLFLSSLGRNALWQDKFFQKTGVLIIS